MKQANPNMSGINIDDYVTKHVYLHKVKHLFDEKDAKHFVYDRISIPDRIDKELNYLEGILSSKQSENGKEKIEINKLRKEAETLRDNHYQQEKILQQHISNSNTLDLKIKESQVLLNEHKLKFDKSKNDIIEMINVMTLKERSFVLQKALNNKNEDIIQLIKNTDIDADFRNGDGVSLMQTAIEVGHKGIIDKLKPLASEESYHPPKIETDSINIQKDKDVVDELVGQMNNINHEIQQEHQEVDVQPTGEHHVDTSMFS